jgi:hypothetical protein
MTISNGRKKLKDKKSISEVVWPIDEQSLKEHESSIIGQFP